MTDRRVYPHAKLRLLKPESNAPGSQGAEPSIQPRVVVLHTHGFNGSAEAVGNYFGRPDIHVESHFSIKKDGVCYQFQYVNQQADAQAAGNAFAVSIETEDDGNPNLPWTNAQCDTIVGLLVWLYREWGIPLVECTTWNGRGVGHHNRFPQWDPDAHQCPGPTRTKQLYTHLLPRAVAVARSPLTPDEDDMLILRTTVNATPEGVKAVLFDFEVPYNNVIGYLQDAPAKVWLKTGIDGKGLTYVYADPACKVEVSFT